MSTLGTFDMVVAVAYLIGVLAVGLLVSRKVKSRDDYYIAGRSLGLIVIMATVCATILGGGAVIGRGGLTYKTGLSAVMAAVPYMVGMYVFTFFAPRIHEIGVRNNISSLADLMEFRFGRTAASLTSALVVFAMVATVGTQITATATVFKTIGAPWGITYNTGAWIATLFFVAYTGASGLFGVAYTDVMQFCVFIPVLYLILPAVALAKVGGFAGLRAAVPAKMWSLRPDATIAGYMVTNFFFTMAGAEMWQRAFASKSERTAFWGFFAGNTVYAIALFSFAVITCMSSIVLFPDLLKKYGTPDAAIPAFATILPLGLGGLLVGGLLAALMSTADSYLCMAGQGFSDLMRKTGLVSRMSSKAEMALERVIVFVFGFLALIFALYVREAYLALMYAWTFFAAAVGPAAVAALFWKKATATGIIASMVAGFVVSMGWQFLKLPLWPSFAGCVASLVVLIVVCLVTYNPDSPSPYPECSPYGEVLKRSVFRR